MSDLAKCFPNMVIKKVMGCEGTDRRWGPPKELQSQEAPFRRSIMKLRENLKVVVDPNWENYAEISNRQLVRKSPAYRVKITMFAAVRVQEPPMHAVPEEAMESEPQQQSETRCRECGTS